MGSSKPDIQKETSLNSSSHHVVQANCNDSVGSFTTSFINVGTYILYFIALLAICNGAHLTLRRISQPRMISESLVGLLLGNWNAVRNEVYRKKDYKGSKNLKYVTDFGMICYMFTLGLEMDPVTLVQLPKKEANIAYFGMLSTFILSCGIIPLFHYAEEFVTSHVFTVAVATVLSSTGSPLLTRVLTDLKIGQSDIGQLAVSAAVHSELTSILLLCVGYVIFQPESNFELRQSVPGMPTANDNRPGQLSIQIAAILVLQVIVALSLGPAVMNWVNRANPQGKTMKGSHLVLFIAFVVAVGSLSPLSGFSPVLSAFMTGVFLPRKGRISKFIIGKVNYFLGFVFYPFFFVWVGLECDFRDFEVRDAECWERLLCFFGIGLVGKSVGAILSGLIYGFPLPESMALGLLLNAKGHLHMYLAIIAKKNQIISNSTCMGMIIAMILSIAYIPLVARYIVERAKKKQPDHKMALEWHDTSKELRLLVCIHGAHNVSSLINLMEITQGTGEPGIVVCATDLVELTDQIASSLAPAEEGDGVTVSDKGVIQMRQEITGELQQYVDSNGEGISLKRMLALSNFSNMHQDLCVLAEDSMVSLIVLPFHKGLQENGTMDSGHSGFRFVNRKMLRYAPCSVAILVDRGFGSIKRISRTSVTVNVAIIFIGGKDDREAIAYATRVSNHPGVKLTVIRFLLDTDSEGSSNLAGLARARMEQQEEEMKLDDECFAEFYEKQVAMGKVAYLEKHLVNSAQAYSTLQSLQGQYNLFIVGRGGRSNSMLTAGMNDLEQCPELGPLGDILSGPNFSATASVLIIQQHSQKANGGNAKEFQVM